MSFYISYTKNIKTRKAPHIFFFEDNVLCMFSNKTETRILELDDNIRNPLVAVIDYIEKNGIDNSEILLPVLDEEFLNEACDSISQYLLENDDSIGILTNNYNFREDYSWILSKYGITYSIPREKPSLGVLGAVKKPKSKKKPKCVDAGGIDIEPKISLKSCAPIRLEDDLESGLIMDEPFNVKFIKMLNESGKSNVEVYTKGGITRQVFSNILSKKDFIPKKDTIICLIIGMELNYVDGVNLLASAGYTLSKSIVSDVIVMKHLKRGVYDLDIINDELDERGCSMLGWKPRGY